MMSAWLPGSARDMTATEARCVARSISAITGSHRELRSMALAVDDSVARIASGREPDDLDHQVLQWAQFAMSQHCELLRFVSAAAASPRRTVVSVQGPGSLPDLVQLSSDQLELDVSGSVEAAEGLIESLREVEGGDAAAASELEPLFQRVAILAEQQTA